MTKTERIKLRIAINRLHDDDGWDDGMTMLHQLLNPDWKNPLDMMRRIAYKDIASMIDGVDEE